jgi:hypothetical protein
MYLITLQIQGGDGTTLPDVADQLLAINARIRQGDTQGTYRSHAAGYAFTISEVDGDHALSDLLNNN